jgi:GNAT superfamily N-acetyltransferase
MTSWEIERIHARHDRGGFTCGRDALDEYLRRYARQNDRADLGRTYVAVLPGEAEVLGYYTLVAGSVAAVEVPANQLRGRPPPEVPVVLLGRLAVARSSQGQGLGRLLLMDALHRALGAADALAINAFVVHADGEAAVGFYRRYGFHPLLDDPAHLFLSLRTIRRAFGLTG